MKEYIIYFEPVMVNAENKEEAVKIAKNHISVDYIEEELGR